MRNDLNERCSWRQETEKNSHFCSNVVGVVIFSVLVRWNKNCPSRKTAEILRISNFIIFCLNSSRLFFLFGIRVTHHDRSFRLSIQSIIFQTQVSFPLNFYWGSFSSNGNGYFEDLSYSSIGHFACSNSCHRTEHERQVGKNQSNHQLRSGNFWPYFLTTPRK